MLLDGQQRMTSLFQALASGEVVQTQDDHKKPIKRWYCGPSLRCAPVLPSCRIPLPPCFPFVPIGAQHTEKGREFLK
jgi:hypothetical protein